MKNSSQHFNPLNIRCGCRPSPLSMIQTQSAIDQLNSLLPFLNWTIIPFSSPGDRDVNLDLRESPDDFFTRDLDEAVQRGDIDCAIHSAKDLPPNGSKNMDWFWLPWKEEPEDALVLREGESEEGLNNGGRIGVSSDRRLRWCIEHYPSARSLSIRGNIEDRLAQLDEGNFDAVLIAVAALNRLSLTDRITRIIPLSELPTPEGQGYLTLSFSQGHLFFQKMRALLHPPVRFVGAGAGEGGWITEYAGSALEQAEVCLYDALIDKKLLHRLLVDCRQIPVGKRFGKHSHSQNAICALLVQYARQGKIVVRLKGGDPGIFGRLREETAALDAMSIPHIVYPGISAMTLGTTGTGLLLTSRGLSRGFRVCTPNRSSSSHDFTNIFPDNKDIPAVVYMSLSKSKSVREYFIKEGFSKDADCSVVYAAGTSEEEIHYCSLDNLDQLPDPGEKTGLILVNLPINKPYRRNGPLRGDRILLTCSTELLERARLGVENAGGRPVLLPLIQQVYMEGSLPSPEEITRYNWIVLTSPMAIRIFLTAYRESGGDYRCLPKIMVCGTSSARVLNSHGLIPDLIPVTGSDTDALAVAAQSVVLPEERILRLRSDVAGTGLGRKLSEFCTEIKDIEFYRTTGIHTDEPCPPFEAAFFASSSAVQIYREYWGVDSLKNKPVLALGQPVRQLLESMGLNNIIVAEQSNAEGAIQTLAIEYFRQMVKEDGIS